MASPQGLCLPSLELRWWRTHWLRQRHQQRLAEWDRFGLAGHERDQPGMRGIRSSGKVRAYGRCDFVADLQVRPLVVVARGTLWARGEAGVSGPRRLRQRSVADRAVQQRWTASVVSQPALSQVFISVKLLIQETTCRRGHAHNVAC